MCSRYRADNVIEQVAEIVMEREEEDRWVAGLVENGKVKSFTNLYLSLSILQLSH